MFTTTGPQHTKLSQGLQKTLQHLSSKQLTLLEHISKYEPILEKERAPKRLQSYLTPLPSHRKGVLGQVASFILWKYFQALSSHLMPVITKAEERLSDLRWDANHSLHHVELLTEQIMLLKAKEKKSTRELIALKKEIASLKHG